MKKEILRGVGKATPRSNRGQVSNKQQQTQLTVRDAHRMGLQLRCAKEQRIASPKAFSWFLRGMSLRAAGNKKGTPLHTLKKLSLPWLAKQTRLMVKQVF